MYIMTSLGMYYYTAFCFGTVHYDIIRHVLCVYGTVHYDVIKHVLSHNLLGGVLLIMMSLGTSDTTQLCLKLP